MDGMLSQEEINALLGGMSQDNDSSAQTSASEEVIADLTPDEKDALGEISNICMGTSATTLYSLVNQKVTITTPTVTISNLEQLVVDYERPCVFINISYKEGIDGNNVLILHEDDVKVITDLMMGGDGTNLVDELSELHLSAICEAMNQMMGSAATSLSSMLNRKIDISPPSADLINLAGEIDESQISSFVKGSFAKVTFRMQIGDLVDSTIMQLYPINFAKELFEIFSSSNTEEEKEPPKQAEAPAPKTILEKPAPASASENPMENNPQASMGGNNQMPYPGQNFMQGNGYPYGGMPYPYVPPMQDINVQPVQFQPFTTGPNPITQQENIDLIMDVPLEVTVELGRTSKSIKEILEFSPGTIIELDRIAGEPIDVLVNNKLVAKGEVVVIEESFGIRVTEIIKQ